MNCAPFEELTTVGNLTQSELEHIPIFKQATDMKRNDDLMMKVEENNLYWKGASIYYKALKTRNQKERNDTFEEAKQVLLTGYAFSCNGNFAYFLGLIAEEQKKYIEALKWYEECQEADCMESLSAKVKAEILKRVWDTDTYHSLNILYSNIRNN